MAITASDIEYRLSGGAANTSPILSLGGAMSTAGGGLITPGGTNNVWDDVSGAEAAAGDTEYRCIYIKNNHGSLTLQSAVLWIDSLTTSTSTEFDIALDPAAVGATATASTSDENTAPTGGTVTFSRPTTKGAGLSIGDIPSQSRKAIWLRRTVTAGAASASDTGSIRVEGDTAP